MKAPPFLPWTFVLSNIEAPPHPWIIYHFVFHKPLYCDELDNPHFRQQPRVLELPRQKEMEEPVHLMVSGSSIDVIFWVNEST